MLTLAVVLFLLTLGLHSTPASAPRLVTWLEDTWERICLRETINCWRWTEDDHGGYYLKPGQSPRLWRQVCIPDPAAGQVWQTEDTHVILRPQRGICDVGAWWVTRRWPTY